VQTTLKAPFNAFDFLGYLIAGFVVITSLGYGWAGIPLPWELSTGNTADTATRITFFIIASYIVGQVTAFLSNVVLQHGLLRATHDDSLDPAFKKLPTWAREQLEEQSKKVGQGVESLHRRPNHWPAFQTAEAVVRKEKDAATLLDRFGSIYTFCRNTSVAFMLATVVVALRWKMVSQRLPSVHVAHWTLTLILAAVAAVLAERFWKYYRVYVTYVFMQAATTLQSNSAKEAVSGQSPLQVELLPVSFTLHLGGHKGS